MSVIVVYLSRIFQYVFTGQRISSLQRVILMITVQLCYTVGMTDAESSDNVIAVVGISLATSLVTTLVTLAIVYAVHRHFTSDKRKSHMSRDGAEMGVRTSFQSQASSTRPLAGRQTSYTPVATIDVRDEPIRTLEQPRKGRYKSDYIAKWCTDHDLSEQTAHHLRQAGFTFQGAIDSLRTEDLSKLGIKNTAQECLLRDIIVKKNKSTRPQLYSTNSHRSRKRSKSTGSEGIPSPDGHNSSASSTRFGRHNSLDEIDGGPGPDVGRPLNLVSKASMGSMEIIDDKIIFTTSMASANDIHNLVTSQQARNHHPRPRPNPMNFQGLLSDKGLYELAHQLGAEWQQLAAVLNIPSNILDQIRMDNPSNTRQQIYRMLEMWRDASPGTKEQIKGKLHDALVRVDRRNLAEDLLMEQVEGSAEKVYHSVI